MDLDLDGGEGVGPASGIALFFKIGEVPFPVVLSLLVLNFWFISMLLIYLPIKHGGIINGLLLIPTLVLAMFVTRYELLPLRKVFRTTAVPKDIAHQVMDQRCVLTCDVSNGRIGQGRIKKNGAGVVINVKAEFDKDTFNKGETAFIFRKDKDKDLYYITKPIFNNDLFKDMEEM